MTAAGVVAALGGRYSRAGCELCIEEGHDRSGRNLAVHERGGRVLLHCHRNPDHDRPMLARLRERGLLPDARREFTAAERRAFAKARAAAADDARRCWHWRVGAGERLNELKRRAIDFERGRFDEAALATAAQALREIEGAGPGGVLQAWRRAWAVDPATAAADERAGREHERLGVLLARAVAGLPVEGRAAA
ncbi:MAG: hypothetical protein KJZ84_02995 [Bryobacteraceae bacterium]|nr:hypothetical protein [Bryobacteraceae bacterium]